MDTVLLLGLKNNPRMPRKARAHSGVSGICQAGRATGGSVILVWLTLQSPGLRSTPPGHPNKNPLPDHLWRQLTASQTLPGRNQVPLAF